MTRRYKTHRVPLGNCPHCGAEIDAAAPVGGHHKKPDSGDVGICMSCGHWMEYQRIDGRLIPIMPSPSTMDELRADDQAMAFELDVRMQAQVNAMRKAGADVREAGKLVFKKEEGFIKAYICKPGGDEDDMKDALLLATIRSGMVKDPDSRDAWISVLKGSISDMFRHISGGQTMWVNETDTIKHGRSE